MHSHLEEQSLWKKLIKQTFWVYFFAALAAPIGYAIKAIIANKLSVEEVGVFYSVMWLITLIASYNDLWLTEAIQYFLPKYRIEKKYNAYKTTFILTVGAQFITWIIGIWLLYLWADRLAINHFHSPVAAVLLRIFARYFVWINLLQVLTSYFSAFQNTFFTHFLTFFKQSAILLGIGYFWWVHNDISLWSVSHATLYGMYVSVLVAIALFLKKYWKTFMVWTFVYEHTIVKKQIHYARWVLLATNIWFLLGNIDQQLVIHFLWPTQAGIYANYMVLLIIYGVLTWPFLALIFPIVTELVTKEQRDKYELLQNILYKYYSCLALAIAWIFIALWPELAMVFFWTKFLYSGVLASISAPFLAVNIMLAVNFTFLAWLWEINQRVKLMWWALVINIVANVLFFLVFHRWLYSPVIATILSWCYLRWWSFKTLNEIKIITIPYRFIAKNSLLITLCVCIILFTKDYFFIESNAFRRHNILIVGLLCFVYCILLLAANYKQWKILFTYLQSFRQK